MKKLIILLVGIAVITGLGEIILPQVITQTFSPICFLPGVTVTYPHWLLERWIPRFNVGFAITLGTVAAYTLLRRKKVING